MFRFRLSTLRHVNSIATVGLLQLLLTTPYAQPCPTTTKLQTYESAPSEAPEGIFAYGSYDKKGVFISPIRHFNPVMLGVTANDFAYNISFSEDGKWLLYTAQGTPWLVNLAIASRIPVPLSQAFTHSACFWRGLPGGQQAICYLANERMIKAIPVELKQQSITFGAERVIVSLNDSLKMFNGPRLVVAADHVFIGIWPRIENAFTLWQSGYIKIPLMGQGVATEKDIQKWTNENFRHTGGCGHALSWDGRLAVADVGTMSNSPCLPHEHKGFTVTPFFWDPTPLRTMEEAIELQSLSMNWCPERYRQGSATEQNFWEWYFGNSDDYLIGNLRGSTAERKGVWLVHWQENRWTFLTDSTQLIEAATPAVHFCSMDTITIDATGWINNTGSTHDPFDPHYKILSPQGGESFQLGDTLQIQMGADKSSNAVLLLSINNRFSWLHMTSSGIDPMSKPLHKIALDMKLLGDKAKKDTTYSKCWVRIATYGSGKYVATTAAPFTIITTPRVQPPKDTKEDSGSGCGRGVAAALLVPLGLKLRRRYNLCRTELDK